MNEYDIDFATMRFERCDTPNRLKACIVIERLAYWANSNSDGWAYWPKPARAAASLMALIESTTSAADDEQERTDATDAELRKALSPVKSFLTRQGVDYAQVIG